MGNVWTSIVKTRVKLTGYLTVGCSCITIQEYVNGERVMDKDYKKTRIPIFRKPEIKCVKEISQTQRGVKNGDCC